MLAGIKSVLLNGVNTTAVIIVIITLVLMLVVVQGFIGNNIFAMGQQGPINLLRILDDRDQYAS